jgi:sigma-B regulation protein RsbU (phosphoserine phosphatase)
MTTWANSGLPPSDSEALRPVHLLIYDPRSVLSHALHLTLKNEGYLAVTVDSPSAMLELARTSGFDLILADLDSPPDTSPEPEEVDLLAALEAQGNLTPVVAMAALGDFDLLGEALRRGACDFILRPWEDAEVLAVVRKRARSERHRESELEVAASVQQRLLPSAGPALQTLEYAGCCVAAQGIGGDYYDFLEAGPGRVGFLLCDVSGKGVPAALLMANLHACFRSRSPEELASSASLLANVNRHFWASTAADRFATLFLGIYDDATRRLQYVNCGHCPPLLLRTGGEIEELAPTATLLGAFADWECRQDEVTIEPGDSLAIYSDGVTEAVSLTGELFGEDRLAGLLREPQPATEFVGGVANAVFEFCGGILTDDVTIVALRGLVLP